MCTTDPTPAAASGPAVTVPANETDASAATTTTANLAACTPAESRHIDPNRLFIVDFSSDHQSRVLLDADTAAGGPVEALPPDEVKVGSKA